MILYLFFLWKFHIHVFSIFWSPSPSTPLYPLPLNSLSTVFWKWYDHWSHKLTGHLVTFVVPAQDKASQNFIINGIRANEVLPLIRKLLKFDGCWERGNIFSLRMWPLRGGLCPVTGVKLRHIWMKLLRFNDIKNLFSLNMLWYFVKAIWQVSNNGSYHLILVGKKTGVIAFLVLGASGISLMEQTYFISALELACPWLWYQHWHFHLMT